MFLDPGVQPGPPTYIFHNSTQQVELEVNINKVNCK
jgi:hypothetical protein